MTLAVYTDHSYSKVVKYLDYRFGWYSCCISIESFTTFENEYPAVDL